MPTPHSPVYVWFDTEFTSLDLESAHLLQVAMVVTDGELRRRGPPESDVVTAVRLPAAAPVSPWVQQHGGALLAAARADTAPTPATVDDLLCRRLDELAGPASADPAARPILAGNSLHNDWWLARRRLPRFAARLHYRHLDVTAYKLEWLRRGEPEFDKGNAARILEFFPDAGPAVAAHARHDAHYDTLASIAELAFYRHTLLTPRRTR